MKITFDLTDDDPREDGGLPDATFWGDDGDIFLRFGELEIRMTYGQAGQLFDTYNKWMSTVGSDNPFDAAAPTTGEPT